MGEGVNTITLPHMIFILVQLFRLAGRLMSDKVVCGPREAY